MNVLEDIWVIGRDRPLSTITRDEHLLLSPPYPSRLPIKLWSDHEPLAVVHYPQHYEPDAFAPPRYVYENNEMRVEWQKSNGRQPFYHRNCDVDEIGYQIAGERTLLTELGTVEHRPGEFSLIPRGIAHDNYGRKESHLLWYVPAPVAEIVTPQRFSQPAFPPFAGWIPGEVNENVTQCMGGLGHDITGCGVDEQLLLNHVFEDDRRLNVLVPDPADSVCWLYATDRIRIGMVKDSGRERRYRRTLDADEIQYQVSGTRTLVSQRGIVDLDPGDFVRIPLGVAYASVATTASKYIATLSHHELPQVATTSRTADPYSSELLASLTSEVRQ
ncbi:MULTISPECIES: hypothetical protein [unclassified Mycolicibacterium]|uniref:hypothetical protein n=1 Tax=unclassified Mycolicibacterium TaxID=2636767 RepID=UPI002EDA5CCE